MNLLAALVVFTATYMLGYPSIPIKIKEVVAGSPAAGAGLQADDSIVAVGGDPIRRIDQVQQYVARHAGQPIALTVQRGTGNVDIHLTPRTPAETPQGQGAMGVVLMNAASYDLVKYPLGQSVTYALGDIGDTVQQIVTLPTRLLSGLIAPSEARVMGPVGISQMAGAAVEQTAKTGEAFWILNLVAAISLALAVTNLLPLPALDGGRLIFVLLEAIRHKRISPEREAIVHLVGMALLLGLMVLITIQDISNPLIPF
jgi:regulator of sigma E protease